MKKDQICSCLKISISLFLVEEGPGLRSCIAAYLQYSERNTAKLTPSPLHFSIPQSLSVISRLALLLNALLETTADPTLSCDHYLLLHLFPSYQSPISSGK